MIILREYQRSPQLVMLLLLTLLLPAPSSVTSIGYGDHLSNEVDISNPEFILIPEIKNYFLLKNSTYFGGSTSNYGHDVVTDSEDNIIVTGYTSSTDFPVINGIQSTNAGNRDVVVAKFDSNGQLLWSTYLGGTDEDEARSITVDSNDNIIVVGKTDSPDFPVLNAAFPTNETVADAFITKFSPDGLLLFSTYLGGTGYDVAMAVEATSQNFIIVAGYTSSDDFKLEKAYNSTYGGSSDCFIHSFTPYGELVWGTYLGGSNTDIINDLAITPTGNIVFVGQTYSADFPVKNALFSTKSQNTDGLFGMMTPDGRVISSSYFSGYGTTRILRVDCGTSHFVFTGETYADDIPIKNALKEEIGYLLDVFVTSISYDGTLEWSTYFGADGDDRAFGLSLDTNDNVIIAGSTSSVSLPLSEEFQDELSSSYDILFAKISKDGALLWSSYFGGNQNDAIYGLDVSNNGNIVLFGFSSSTNYPTKGGYEMFSSGGQKFILTSLLDIDGDEDNDGLVNLKEGQLQTQIYHPDSDKDGIPDGYEYNNGLNPLDPSDAAFDSDNDGLPNLWEYNTGLDCTDPRDALGDLDSDLLSNAKEFYLSTNPKDADTDDDFLEDGEEVLIYSSDPRSNDTDGDTLVDGDEVLIYHTNPSNRDTDGDGTPDNIEINEGRDPLRNDATNPSSLETDTVTVTETTTIQTDSENTTSLAEETLPFPILYTIIGLLMLSPILNYILRKKLVR